MNAIKIHIDIVINDLLSRIFGPKRDEAEGDWREPHNDELHKLNSSPNIIRMFKKRRMRWAGHVARKGRRGMYIGFCGKAIKKVTTIKT
jgi:hypothetical protein